MVGAMVSKSLIQFSTDGQGCVPSLLLDLRPNYGGANEDNGELLQKVPCKHCCTQCLWPSSRSPPTHASTGDSWKLISMSGSVSCGWCTQVLFVPSKSLFPQSYVSSGGSMVRWMPTSSKRAYAIPWSAAPRAPAAGHCWPIPPQETLKHSSDSISLDWACFLCPSQVWAPQVTRCLMSALSQEGHVS